MTSEPVIRFATTYGNGYADVPTIHSFIVAGCEEQAPGTSISVTEDTLTATLHFADKGSEVATTGIAQRFAWPLVIVAPDGDIAGLAIYFYNYTTWKAAPGACLEEFYVVPKYRRRGYGKLLIEAMARETQKAGCVKLEWLCLKDNKQALALYERCGATRKDNWVVLRVDEIDIARLAAGRKGLPS